MRWLRERSLRSDLTLVSLVGVLATLTVFIVLYANGARIRKVVLQGQQLLQYHTAISQSYLSMAQALITAEAALEEARQTHDAYRFQWQILPRLTELNQHLAELRALNETLPQDDRLKPYLLQNIQLAQNASSSLKEAIRLAREGQWPSVVLRIHNLRAHYNQSRLPLSVLASEIDRRVAASQATIQRLMRTTLLFNSGVVLLLLLTLLAESGLLIRTVITPIERLMSYLQRFAQGDLGVRAPEPARPPEIRHLAHTFNQMADQITAAQLRLEHQVEERTAALRRRSEQLQAAAEVGRIVASLTDLDTILQEATRLIAARFNVYHVGIFLLDASGTYAVLRAANSEGGQRMLRRGHRLKVGEEGIVGYVTGSGRPRIALDVGRDAVHFRNPDLPETRSEAALPLRVGEKILGALDIQSIQPAAFSQEDLNALQLLADLLATAIYNARLLQESQEAVENLQRTYAQVSRRGWATFAQQQTIQGYRLDEQGRLLPLVEEEQAQEASQPTTALESGEDEHHILELPLEVRGTPVARLRLRKPEGRPWNRHERRLVTELSRRLSSALEGARLYTESQRRAAQLQAVAEIARDASGTLELESLLASAVELIRERFGFYHASVFLLDEAGTYAEVRASTSAEMLQRHHRLAVGSASIVGQSTASGEPVVVNDTQTSAIHRPHPLLPETRAELALPLKVGDRIIGALDVQATRRNAFSQEDVQALQILADQLAVAVSNARLFAEVQEHLESHRELHAVLAAATAAATVEEALQKATEAIHRMRPDMLVALLIAEPNQKALRVVAAQGHRKGVVGMTIPYGQGITGWVAEHQELVRSNQVAEDPRYLEGTPGVQSELAIPLLYRGELIGVLDLESPRPNAFDESDQELFRTLATSLAAVLTNIRLLEAARQRAEQLQLLNEISAIAAAHVNQIEMLRAVLPRLVEGLGGQMGGALLRQGRQCSLVALYPEELRGSLPSSAEVLAKQFPQHQPVFMSLEEQNLPPHVKAVMERTGLQHFVMLPLSFRDELSGVLHVGFTEARNWSEGERRLLEQIARQISTSLEVARLFEAATRRAERERLVTEITTRLRASNDPQEILQTAVRELQRALRAEIAQVVLVNGEATSGSES